MADPPEATPATETRQVRLRKRVVRDRQADLRSFALVLAIGSIAILVLLRYLVSSTQFLLAKSDAAQTENLYFTLRIAEVDRSYAKGQPIGLKLSVRNTSGHTVYLPFDSDQEFDFQVKRQINLFFVRLPIEVWRYTAARTPKPQPHSLMILPSEEKIFRARWPQVDNAGQQVRPGRYVISGYVNHSGNKQALEIQAPPGS